MKLKRCLVVCALLALELSGCRQLVPGANTSHNNTSNQILTERVGAPPSAHNGDMMAGVIEKLDGRMLQLKRPMLGQTVTVRIAETASLVMQATVTPSAIQPGDPVAISGTPQGAVFNAVFVQIGPAGALGGGPLAIREDNAVGNAPNALQPTTTDTAPASDLSGTVATTDTNRFTVQTDDGQTIAVQLIEGSTIRKQQRVGLDALEPGRFVIASGAHQAAGFEISELEVLPPPGMF